MYYIVLVILARLVVVVLYAMLICMFGRAIMSWFSPEEDNKLAQFLFMMTEPFVYPIRKLLSKIEFFNNMPIDMSYMVAMLILIVCTTALSGNLIMY